MSLRIQRIRLTNFRNFSDAEVTLASGMTVLVGHNAVGKTNTIEALQLLTTGTSFRHPRSSELLRIGADTGRIESRIEGDGRVLDVCCTITTSRRTFSKNGKTCKAADLLGTLMSILFCPDDLSFVKGSARIRREELDGFGSQAHPGYNRVVKTYLRSVEQRNSFLKEPDIDPSLLDAWDESIATGAAVLLGHRLSLFHKLAPIVSRIYSEIASGETLECRYVCSAGSDVEQMNKEELREHLWTKLHEGRSDDIRRQQTLIGPHRDDIAFLIQGKDARAFASQGQQRSIVLAWKMAEVELAQTLVGQKPLLLLDDVMSELDETRRAAMCTFIETGVQTVLTTTNLGYFSPSLLDQAKVVTFDG